MIIHSDPYISNTAIQITMSLSVDSLERAEPVIIIKNPTSGRWLNCGRQLFSYLDIPNFEDYILIEVRSSFIYDKWNELYAGYYQDYQFSYQKRIDGET